MLIQETKYISKQPKQSRIVAALKCREVGIPRQDASLESLLEGIILVSFESEIRASQLDEKRRPRLLFVVRDHKSKRSGKGDSPPSIGEHVGTRSAHAEIFFVVHADVSSAPFTRSVHTPPPTLASCEQGLDLVRRIFNESLNLS